MLSCTVRLMSSDDVLVCFQRTALEQALRLRTVQHVGYGVSIRAAARGAWAARLQQPRPHATGSAVSPGADARTCGGRRRRSLHRPAGAGSKAVSRVTVDRTGALERLATRQFDLLVIGGGTTEAAAAHGRGRARRQGRHRWRHLERLLQLDHGGLRYLRGRATSGWCAEPTAAARADARRRASSRPPRRARSAELVRAWSRRGSRSERTRAGDQPFS